MPSIRANMEESARVFTPEAPWSPSPMAGVERQMLDRVGDEVARATSVVRYAPDSRFSSHEHGGGEEIFVLEGVFSDEHGVYPAGTYLRNPPGSRHAPFTQAGCRLFVKLRQFAPDDDTQLTLDTRSASFLPGQVPGLTVLPLHQHRGVSTALVRWAPGCTFLPHRHWGGEEIFVLEGVFSDEHGDYPAGTWLRSPHLSQHSPFSREGCLIYVKVGHLSQG